MSKSDHIKQQVVQEFFAKQNFFVLLEDGKTGFFCFIEVEEAANTSKYQ